MFNIIQEIVFKSIGRRDVTMDTDFIKDLNLNSFDLINIIADIEQQFKIVIPTKDLRNIRTIRDCMEYANARGVNK